MTINRKCAGVLEALLSAGLFGLIPFFFLPLYNTGFTTESSIFFRFLFATLIMMLIALVKKQNIRISFKNLVSISVIAFTYYVAALGLFSALTYMPSGIVTTIFFTNPIFVMILAIFFLKERLEPYKVVFSLITCGGVALLSGFFDNMEHVDITGIFLSTFAGIAYAFYIMGLYKIQVDNVSKEILSFYLFIVSTSLAGMYAFSTDTFMLPRSSYDWFMLASSGLVTAVMANILLMSAIVKIGSVLSSILGAMEPITAVVVGIIVFHEAVNAHVIIGIVIVIVSVVLLTVIPMFRHRQQ